MAAEKTSQNAMIQPTLAEFIGTFTLVFIGAAVMAELNPTLAPVDSF
jgi:glycerol uptake facilitator-like aquaporin